MSTVRIAAVQMDPKIGEVEANVARVVETLESTDAQLAVYPECALTGYGFGSIEEARRHPQPMNGRAVAAILDACRRSGRWAVVGTLERGDRGEIFNSAFLAGPDGVAGVYRKMHIPFMGADRFVTPGDRGFPVFETPLGRIGMLVCYDGSFPEAARMLKLGGAQLICLPTNWPEAAEVSCRYSPMVRAQENHVNFIACNRAGTESGFRFRGESKICDFGGAVLAEAGRGEEIIAADLDLAGADTNRVVIVPGEYELDRIGHRRPDQYARLATLHARRTE